MRAIADWYFTAHPPIMHDLHESLPLLYTYSGAAPQNPNLDPLLFAELPWFANWEMAQMTKYGMPGVYTHAFMDGWSPGYLGSIAYNHNGLMKMYETNSGRDLDTAQVASAFRRAAARADSGRPDPAAGQHRAGVAPSRAAAGGAQEREWYRGIAIDPLDSDLFTRRANANYMQTGVLSALQLASMFPATVLENFYVKTRNSIADGMAGGALRLRDSGPARHDPRRRNGEHPPDPADRGGRRPRVRSTLGGHEVRRRRYVIKRNQPYGRLAKNLLERQHYPDARLSTYDDSGWTMGLAMNVQVVEVADSTILERRGDPGGQGRRSWAVWLGTGTAGLADRPFRVQQHDHLPVQAEGHPDAGGRRDVHRRRHRIPGGVVPGGRLDPCPGGAGRCRRNSG